MNLDKRNKILIGGGVVIILFLVVAGIYSYINLGGKQFSFTPKETTADAVPGSCLVVQEKYCKSGKLIYSRMLGSDAIAFKIPEGTSIFAPYDGEILIMDTQESETANKYPLYLVYKDGKYDEIFNAVFTPSLSGSTEDIIAKLNGAIIPQGTIVGYVSGANIYSMDYPQENYNLIITFKKKGVQRVDEWNLDPAMKKLFNL